MSERNEIFPDADKEIVDLLSLTPRQTLNLTGEVLNGLKTADRRSLLPHAFYMYCEEQIWVMAAHGSQEDYFIFSCLTDEISDQALHAVRAGEILRSMFDKSSPSRPLLELPDDRFPDAGE